MKTRILHTKFWTDNYINELSHLEKLAFLYLLTNDKVNLCGIYELPDRNICFDLNIDSNELEKIKAKFTKDGKFTFYKGWLKIINYEKYQQYTGEKNEIALKRELVLAPQELLSKIPHRYPIDSLINHKPKTINQKPTGNKLKNKPAVKPGLDPNVLMDLAEVASRDLSRKANL